MRLTTHPKEIYINAITESKKDISHAQKIINEGINVSFCYYSKYDEYLEIAQGHYCLGDPINVVKEYLAYAYVNAKKSLETENYKFDHISDVDAEYLENLLMIEYLLNLDQIEFFNIQYDSLNRTAYYDSFIILRNYLFEKENEAEENRSRWQKTRIIDSFFKAVKDKDEDAVVSYIIKHLKWYHMHLSRYNRLRFKEYKPDADPRVDPALYFYYTGFWDWTALGMVKIARDQGLSCDLQYEYLPIEVLEESSFELPDLENEPIQALEPEPPKKWWQFWK